MAAGIFLLLVLVTCTWIAVPSLAEVCTINSEEAYPWSWQCAQDEQCEWSCAQDEQCCFNYEGCCRKGTTCYNGREYSECGAACPVTCDNINNPPEPCTYQCVQGCFCPDGLIDSGGSCMQPQECSGYQDPCDQVRCRMDGYTCKVHLPTNTAYFEQTCNNQPCDNDSKCFLIPEDCYSTYQPCPQEEYCVLTCDDEECPIHDDGYWNTFSVFPFSEYPISTTYVPSCSNGYETVYVGRFGINYLTCYSSNNSYYIYCRRLLTNPPPINLVPLPNDTLLITLTVTGLYREELGRVMMAVTAVLQMAGYNVSLTIYSITEKDRNIGLANLLYVVVKIKFLDQLALPGDDVVSILIMDNKHNTPYEVYLNIVEISSDVPSSVLSTAPSSVFSTGAIIGIAIGGVSLVAIVAVLAVVAVGLLCGRTKKARTAKLTTPEEVNEEPQLDYSKLQEAGVTKKATENEYTALPLLEEAKCG